MFLLYWTAQLFQVNYFEDWILILVKLTSVGHSCGMDCSSLPYSEVTFGVSFSCREFDCSRRLFSCRTGNSVPSSLVVVGRLAALQSPLVRRLHCMLWSHTTIIRLENSNLAFELYCNYADPISAKQAVEYQWVLQEMLQNMDWWLFVDLA